MSAREGRVRRDPARGPVEPDDGPPSIRASSGRPRTASGSRRCRTRAAASMPPNTGVPTARRLAAPAPSAMTRGSRPRMKAKLVIITGRKRSRAPSTAESRISLAVSPLLDGELDDQDAVLGGERHQHHQADLGIDVEGEAQPPHEGDGAQHADGDRQQHRQRDVPALVERHQEEIGEQDGEPQHDAGLAGRRLLLQRRARPFEAVAGRQRRRRQSAPWQPAPGPS